jgi:hypothetical protein
MNDLYLQTSPEHTREGLARVRYFPRMLVTVDDMETEHAYFREKLRRHNRYLHGWGVVCGLEVTAAPREGFPWCAHISEGYALGPYGDEIYVPAPGIDLDLANCGPGAATDPCEPGAFVSTGEAASGQTFYVAIKFAECLSHPVRAMPPGCGCEEELCEYSRIRDSFAFGCLERLPVQPEAFDLCEFLDGTRLPVCPPCPDEPWVVLAGVDLLAAGENEMQKLNVDYSVRRQIFSTAVLQEALERCCCKKQPEEMADLKVAEILDVGDSEGNKKRVQYTLIRVANAGKATAKNVTVTSTIKGTTDADGSSSVVSAVNFTSSPSLVKWTKKTAPGPFEATIDSLGNGEEITLGLTVDMPEDTTSVINEVKVSSTTNDPNKKNNTLSRVTSL